MDEGKMVSQDQEPDTAGKKVKHSLLQSIDSLHPGGFSKRIVKRVSSHRGVYLVPNIITTLSLFSAFNAIVFSIEGEIQYACIAVLISMFLDFADGGVARFMNIQSDFGAHYDSIVDVVAFGVAPSLIAFMWCLSSLDKLGIIFSFVYLACVALRLARFGAHEEDLTSFEGLPSPLGASIVVLSVWVLSLYFDTASKEIVAYLFSGIVLVSALLMVSTFRYASHKLFSLKAKASFFALVSSVLLISLIFIKPAVGLLFLALCYAASGPLLHLYGLFRHGRSPNSKL